MTHISGNTSLMYHHSDITRMICVVWLYHRPCVLWVAHFWLARIFFMPSQVTVPWRKGHHGRDSCGWSKATKAEPFVLTMQWANSDTLVVPEHYALNTVFPVSLSAKSPSFKPVTCIIVPRNYYLPKQDNALLSWAHNNKINILLHVALITHIKHG